MKEYPFTDEDTISDFKNIRIYPQISKNKVKKHLNIKIFT